MHQRTDLCDFSRLAEGVFSIGKRSFGIAKQPQGNRPKAKHDDLGLISEASGD